MMPIDLNPTSQKQLYEQACRRMTEMIPGWTDNIPSDPAVAILELACCLSDMQNNKWNQVGPDHYRAYLKLLGGAPQKLTPAALLARPLGESQPYLGQRFWVDGVSYEVVEKRRTAGEICSVLAECDAMWTKWVPESTLCLDGETVRLELAFTCELPKQVPIRIWCGLATDPDRVPPDSETPPPIALLAQGYDGAVWRDIAMEDGTCGLLQSGYWRLTSQFPFTALRVAVQGHLEGCPVIQQLVLEPARLEQRQTRSQAVNLPAPFRLPEGWVGNQVLRYFLPADGGGWREASALFAHNGLVAGWTGGAPEVIRVVSAEPDFAFEYSIRPIAGEEIVLGEEGILPESLGLMVQEEGVWYDCPIREPNPDETLNRGCRWDGERRALCFGDGRDYRVPAGGTLLVSACATTLGSAGNGAAGVLSQDSTRLLALSPAAGGCDKEPEKEAFYRTVKEQAQPLRAVTLEDYEMLARKTPGLALGQIHAVAYRTQGKKRAGVTVLARPLSQEPLPLLTPWQTQRLQTWLEQFRMIGVPVSIQSPRYVPLSVTVSVRVSEPIDSQLIRAAVMELADGVTGHVPFGAEVSYTALLAALGALGDVIAVTALELHPLSGGVRRTQDGGIRLQPDMLPYLKELQVTQM